MDLYIRSQDKMKLVNNCNLYISNEIRNEYVIEDLSNKYLKLGTYKTKERALEVLGEIQKILEPQLIIKNSGKIIGSFEDTIIREGATYELKELSTYVYEMPKE